jgi:thymidine kinase
MTATLTTVAGPMYAGKTSYILQKILWHNHCNEKVLVIKPGIDNRYSQDHIETHNRLKFPCITMTTWTDVLDKYNLMPYNYHTVFIDEVQFMDTETTLAVVHDMLTNGVNVVAAGLDQDSRGQPFETTAMLLALSDKVDKIQAICTSCGQVATKTQRSEATGDRVAVGSIGMYEPRCLNHWEPK